MFKKLFIFALILFTPACFSEGDDGGIDADISSGNCAQILPYGSNEAGKTLLVDRPVYPAPKIVVGGAGLVDINTSWTIYVKSGNATDLKTAEMLRADIKDIKGIELPLVEYDNSAPPEGKNRIFVETSSAESFVGETISSKDIDLNSFAGCKDAYILYAGEDLIFFGSSPSGTFYATQTFWWLLKGFGSGELPAFTIADWPDLNVRGFLVDQHLKEDNSELLSRLKLNRMVTYTSVGGLVNQEASESYRKYRHIKLIPMPDPVNLLPHGLYQDAVIETPELLEGWYVEKEPFKIYNGALIPVHNYDQELDLIILTSGSDPTAGWIKINGASDYNGIASSIRSNWYPVDKQYCRNNNKDCLKVIATKPSQEEVLNRTLERSYSLEPGLYALEGYVMSPPDDQKDNCEIRFAVTVESEDTERTHSYVVGRREDETAWQWSKFAFPFYISKKGDTYDINITAHVVGFEKCTSAVFFVDDLKIRRLNGALRNVVVTDATDIEIEDAYGKVLIEGTDYLVSGKEGPLPDTYNRLSDPFNDYYSPRILKISWINKAWTPAILYVSYNMLFNYRRDDSYHTTRAVSIGEPMVYEQFEEKMIKPLFEASGDNIEEILLPFDEIRAFNRDSRNFDEFGTKKENWELFKEYLEKQTAIVEKYFGGGVKTGFMEMMAPTHNGGNECYLKGFGQWQDNCGKTGLGMGGLDTGKFFYAPWAYGAEDVLAIARNSVGLASKLGFNFIPQVSMRKGNIEGWKSVFLSHNYWPLGMIGTTYGYEYKDFWADSGDEKADLERRLGLMKDFAEGVWNVKALDELETQWETCNASDCDNCKDICYERDNIYSSCVNGKCL